MGVVWVVGGRPLWWAWWWWWAATDAADAADAAYCAAPGYEDTPIYNNRTVLSFCASIDAVSTPSTIHQRSVNEPSRKNRVPVRMKPWYATPSSGCCGDNPYRRRRYCSRAPWRLPPPPLQRIHRRPLRRCPRYRSRQPATGSATGNLIPWNQPLTSPSVTCPSIPSIPLILDSSLFNNHNCLFLFQH